MILMLSIIVLLLFCLFLVSWYCKQNINKLMIQEQHIQELIEEAELVDSNLNRICAEMVSYSEHLIKVVQKNMYYSDDYLDGMINHTKYIIALLEEYKTKEEFNSILVENLRDTK